MPNGSAKVCGTRCRKAKLEARMTLDELDREYTALRQQSEAVRSYL